ncbi:hypothetical protein NQ318_012788 [Aromia moschata]|uniref:Uncharacterized protein n=1 Tax=Aromia moschata TaxID=1265417 RepID=A0AAV8YHG5_9CUCU|nr:hypothetical protein NQ318_012788 [Aromia moschata]
MFRIDALGQFAGFTTLLIRDSMRNNIVCIASLSLFLGPKPEFYIGKISQGFECCLAVGDDLDPLICVRPPSHLLRTSGYCGYFCLENGCIAPQIYADFAI